MVLHIKLQFIYTYQQRLYSTRQTISKNLRTKKKPTGQSQQLTMPQASTNNEPTLSGPRKRKTPLDGNGEPVVLEKKRVGTKRAKKTNPPTGPAPSKQPAKTHSAQKSNVQPSVEDVVDEQDYMQPNPPKNSRHILEAADGSDDEVIDIDDESADETTKGSSNKPEKPEEDDEAELGLLVLFVYWLILM